MIRFLLKLLAQKQVCFILANLNHTADVIFTYEGGSVSCIYPGGEEIVSDGYVFDEEEESFCLNQIIRKLNKCGKSVFVVRNGDVSSNPNEKGYEILIR